MVLVLVSSSSLSIRVHRRSTLQPERQRPASAGSGHTSVGGERRVFGEAAFHGSVTFGCNGVLETKAFILHCNVRANDYCEGDFGLSCCWLHERRCCSLQFVGTLRESIARGHVHVGLRDSCMTGELSVCFDVDKNVTPALRRKSLRLCACA